MNANGKIQAVIFDVGGVLDAPADRVQADRAIGQVAAELGMELDEMWDLFYRTETWKLARTGQITDKEFWHRNLSPFGITDPSEQAVLAQRLMACKKVVRPMRDLLAELFPRTRLAIISNASDTLEETLAHDYQIDHFFELIVNSARVGYAKPDPVIYQIALKRLELAPQQTIFIDDQQHNVDAANELGIHATLFRDIDALRAFLAQAGVIEVA